ncbi:MAG: hypothetical protein RXR06_10585 [Thermoproteus sp.]
MRIIELAYWRRGLAGYTEAFIEAPKASFDVSSFRLNDGTLSLRSSRAEIRGMYVSLPQEETHTKIAGGVKKTKKVENGTVLAITEGEESDLLFLVKFEHEEYFPAFLPSEPYTYEEIAYDKIFSLYTNSLYIKRRFESNKAKRRRASSPPYSATDSEVTTRTLKVVPLL